MDAARGGLIAFVAATACLAFIAGAFAVILELPPSDALRTAYRAGQALIAQHTDYRDVLRTDHWRKARTDAGKNSSGLAMRWDTPQPVSNNMRSIDGCSLDWRTGCIGNSGAKPRFHASTRCPPPGITNTAAPVAFSFAGRNGVIDGLCT